MRRSASDRLVLGAFAILAASSLGLKAAAGPPRDGLMDVPSEVLDRQLSSELQTQHFTVRTEPFIHRTSMVLGIRGSCRVGVRDAREGVAHEVLFAQDAASIGPVRYFFKGKSYDHPPTFGMRIGRLEAEAMSRLGLEPRKPALIAFAASPECGSSDFGLSDFRI